jgi:predicted XRE-type DNA-binding protein
MQPYKAERRRDPVPSLKQQLAAEFLSLLEGHDREWAAREAGIDGWRVSDLQRGDLTRFSLQKLVRMLARLGRRVTITVTPTGEMNEFRRPGETVPRSPFQQMQSMLSRGATLLVGPDGIHVISPGRADRPGP